MSSFPSRPSSVDYYFFIFIPFIIHYHTVSQDHSKNGKRERERGRKDPRGSSADDEIPSSSPSSAAATITMVANRKVLDVSDVSEMKEGIPSDEEEGGIPGAGHLLGQAGTLLSLAPSSKLVIRPSGIWKTEASHEPFPSSSLRIIIGK